MPSFDEILDQTRALLQTKGRVSYRALKLRFGLDDEYVEGLKDELIDAEQLARDESGKVLVWTGAGGAIPSTSDQQPSSQSPSTYTPQHLAERIRAEYVCEIRKP